MPQPTLPELAELRWIILERDNHTCQSCGASAPNSAIKLYQVVRGTDWSHDNLVARCEACGHGAYLAQARTGEVSRADRSIAGRVRDTALRHPDWGPATVAGELGIARQRATPYMPRLVDRVEHELREHGPATATQLAATTGRRRPTIATMLHSGWLSGRYTRRVTGRDALYGLPDPAP